MTPNFKTFIALMGALALMVFLSSCTFARFTTSSGVSAVYFDVHPTGNAVYARGVLDGVGSFDVDRDTADSGDVITSVVDSLTSPL